MLPCEKRLSAIVRKRHGDPYADRKAFILVRKALAEKEEIDRGDKRFYTNMLYDLLADTVSYPPLTGKRHPAMVNPIPMPETISALLYGKRKVINFDNSNYMPQRFLEVTLLGPVKNRDAVGGAFNYSIENDQNYNLFLAVYYWMDDAKRADTVEFLFKHKYDFTKEFEYVNHYGEECMRNVPDYLEEIKAPQSLQKRTKEIYLQQIHDDELMWRGDGRISKYFETNPMLFETMKQMKQVVDRDHPHKMYDVLKAVLKSCDLQKGHE